MLLEWFGCEVNSGDDGHVSRIDMILCDVYPKNIDSSRIVASQEEDSTHRLLQAELAVCSSAVISTLLPKTCRGKIGQPASD